MAPASPMKFWSMFLSAAWKGPRSNGHGLGLAFVEAVVRAHGGSIEASNRSTGGARLAITLPLLSNQHVDAAPSMAIAS